jgi:hypothetical protein
MVNESKIAWPTTETEMAKVPRTKQELTALKKIMLTRVFGSIHPDSKCERMLTIASSIQQKSITEYSNYIDGIEGQFKRDGKDTILSNYFAAVYSLENSITALYRSMACIDHLRSGCYAHKIKVKWPTATDKKTIKDLRDNVEHLHSKIVSGSIADESYSSMLKVENTGQTISIGDLEVSISKLVSIIDKTTVSINGIVAAWTPDGPINKFGPKDWKPRGWSKKN